MTCCAACRQLLSLEGADWWCERGEGDNSLVLEAASFISKLPFWSRTGAWLTAASWGNSAWFPLARSPAPSGQVAAAAETERGGFLLLRRESWFLPGASLVRAGRRIPQTGRQGWQLGMLNGEL